MSVLTLDIGGTKIAGAIVDAGRLVGERWTLPTPAADGAEAVLAACLAVAERVLQAAGERAVRSSGAHIQHSTGEGVEHSPRARIQHSTGGDSRHSADAGMPGTAGAVVVEPPGVEPPVVGPPDRLAIATAGVVDSEAGIITHATDLISGWAGTPVGPRLGQALNLPAVVINDVHAHALGEAHYGAGVGADSMVLIALGTGIGGAYAVSGRLIRGRHGVAGHVGHVPVPSAAGLPCSCGALGHVEAVASGSAVLTAYREAGGVAGSGADIDAAAAGGQAAAQALARRVLARAGTATGELIGGLLNVLDPDVVVLAGSMASAGEPWRSSLDAAVAATALPAVAAAPLRHASTGVAAVHLGAAYAAGDRRATLDGASGPPASPPGVGTPLPPGVGTPLPPDLLTPPPTPGVETPPPPHLPTLSATRSKDV